MRIKKAHFRKLKAVLATGNIGFLLHLAREYTARRTRQKAPASTNGEIRERPRKAHFSLTLRCNLACRMCHQTDMRKSLANEVSLPQIETVLRNLRAFGVDHVGLVGGEIFVRKDIWDVLDLLDRERFLYSITTNGTLFKDGDIRRLGRLKGLLEIETSIDGLEHTHDQVRGVKGAYEKTVTAIKELKREGIPVLVVTVIQKDNLTELEQLVTLYKAWNVDAVLFLHEISVTADEIRRTEQALQRLSGEPVEVTMSHSVDSSCYQYTKEAFVSAVRNARRTCRELGLHAHFSFTDDGFEAMYDRTLRQEFNLTCPSLLQGMQVDWEGQVSLCPFIRIKDPAHTDLTSLVSGNPINGALFRELRKHTLGMNLLPVCQRCCSVRPLRRRAREAGPQQGSEVAAQ